MDNIILNVTYLAALSMAAERLVEILRGLRWFELVKPDKPDPKQEIKRVATLNLLAVGAGIVTAILAKMIGSLPADNAGVVVYGVLAGAGSGFWNTVLAYLLQLKELKKADARAMAAGQEATVEMKIARAAA